MSGLKFGKTGIPSKVYPLFGRIPGYRRCFNMLYSLRKFSQDEIAQERLKIIKFYDEFGEKASKEAFGVDRKLIYVWRKKMKTHRNKLSCLIPDSTRPKTVRKMTTNSKIVAFIKKTREKHPRLGKEKIKPLLDEYCQEIGIASISESTIGKVIKRKKFFFQKSGRIYHNPNSKWAQKSVKKKKRLRIKHSPKHKDFGHIQSDTVERIIDGVKEYFYSAIDARMKFCLTLNYKRLNSRNNKDFYYKFKSCYPGQIKDWQSDNGKENLGEFDRELEKDKIPHLFSYPKCPKINGIIERYNRTIQEEFINNNLDIIHDKILFNKKLAEYLVFYNTKRVHKSLGLKSPMDYLIEQGSMSNKSVTYTGI